MTHFEHYCKTLRCKMSKDGCIGRQLLALKPHTYRINAHSSLLNEGFYPECYACPNGRQLARSLGINIPLLRGQLRRLRNRIKESAHIGYVMRPTER